MKLYGRALPIMSKENFELLSLFQDDYESTYRGSRR